MDNNLKLFIKKGDVLVWYQKVIDRKIFVETRSITPVFVEVQKIHKHKWKQLISIKTIQTKETFVEYIESFRELTKSERTILFLQERLSELGNIY